MSTIIRRALIDNDPACQGYKTGFRHNTGFLWNPQDEIERGKLNTHRKFLRENSLFSLSPHHPKRLDTSQRIALAIFGWSLFLDDRNRVDSQGNPVIGIDISYIRREKAALHDLAEDVENSDDERGQKFIKEISGKAYEPWFQELLGCVELVRMLAS